MVEIASKGYGFTPIVVVVTVDLDGRVIDNLTVSHSETNGMGGVQLEDGAYNTEFNGKYLDEVEHVDTVNGATITTYAYKKAILYAITVVNAIENN